ncbi:MAG: 2-C-methyl-D-erythritol 4-phosphate cytidylyltransferase [Bacteroidales bacterium]|nr:2-C-methyl-D-erythritol 4-phosphate cytidylyltransferase [Bacteroidales bacterium]
MQNFVAILAGGKGSRMETSQPKQFEMLNGKTVLEHSIDTFEKHQDIHGIFVVVHHDFVENTRRLLNINNRPKIKEIVVGGEKRADSSYQAILAIEKFCYDQQFINNPQMSVNVLIHDAARPFVSGDIITRTLDALQDNHAVSVAIPATDTIYICNDEHKIVSSPNRQMVYHAQTPQAARLPIFKQAFDLARETFQNDATDDVNVILNHLPGEEIHIVLGDIANKKITFQADLTA